MRSRARRLVYALVVTLLVLLGAEGLLRLTLPVAAQATMPEDVVRVHMEGPGFAFDPDLGWYWAHVGGGAPINDYGMRQAAPMSRTKPEGTWRAICFGDSQTYGAGLEAEEAWPRVANRELGQGWEVLNAGLSGYRSLQVYRLIRLRMAALDPDVLVVDNMPYDSPRENAPLRTAAYGESALDAARRALWDVRLYYALRLFLFQIEPAPPRWLSQSGGDKAKADGLGNFDLIHRWGEDNGVEVVFLQYPAKLDQTQVECMADRKDFDPAWTVVWACEALQQDGRPANVLFQDRNHLTVAGAEVVGRAVAETLRALRAAP